jgi:hypothetical protein
MRTRTPSSIEPNGRRGLAEREPQHRLLKRAWKVADPDVVVGDDRAPSEAAAASASPQPLIACTPVGERRDLTGSGVLLRTGREGDRDLLQAERRVARVRGEDWRLSIR